MLSISSAVVVEQLIVSANLGITEKTEYLYFVAEKDGHHRFTKTYAEHLKAIEDIHGPQ